VVEKVGGGGGQRKLQNTFEKGQHPTPSKGLKVGEQDAYLAQVALSQRQRRLPRPPRSAPGSPFCSTLRPGHSRAVCVRGRGRGRWGRARAPACGAGVWGRPGARLPSLVARPESDFPGLRREGRGGLSQAGTGCRSIPTLSYGLYRGVWGPETTLEAQGGVTEHPPFQEQETSSRGRSLPPPLLGRGRGGASSPKVGQADLEATGLT